MNHQSATDQPGTEKCVLGKHVVCVLNHEVWFNGRQIKYLSVDSVKALSDTLKRYTPLTSGSTNPICVMLDHELINRKNAELGSALDMVVLLESAYLVEEESTRRQALACLTTPDFDEEAKERVEEAIGAVTVKEARHFVVREMTDPHTNEMRQTLPGGNTIHTNLQDWGTGKTIVDILGKDERLETPSLAVAILVYLTYRKLNLTIQRPTS